MNRSNQYLPVDGLEEGVGFDVLDPVCPVSQPVLRVSLEEDSEKTLGLRREELRHAQLGPGRGGGGRELGERERERGGWGGDLLQNHCHGSLPVLSLERQGARQHLILQTERKRERELFKENPRECLGYHENAK